MVVANVCVRACVYVCRFDNRNIFCTKTPEWAEQIYSAIGVRVCVCVYSVHGSPLQKKKKQSGKRRQLTKLKRLHKFVALLGTNMWLDRLCVVAVVQDVPVCVQRTCSNYAKRCIFVIFVCSVCRSDNWIINDFLHTQTHTWRGARNNIFLSTLHFMFNARAYAYVCECVCVLESSTGNFGYACPISRGLRRTGRVLRNRRIPVVFRNDKNEIRLRSSMLGSYRFREWRMHNWPLMSFVWIKARKIVNCAHERNYWGVATKIQQENMQIVEFWFIPLPRISFDSAAML